MRGRVTMLVGGVCGLLLGLAAGSPASAGQRVLLAFDASGHRVHRVRESGAGDLQPASRAPKAVPVDPVAAAVAGDAVLVWRDAGGQVLATRRVPDPRLGHAPAGEAIGSATPGGRVALAEGAWQARAPEAARFLELRLPARDEPALSAEEWLLPLDVTSVP